MKSQEQILKLVTKLLAEGEAVLSTEWEKSGNYLTGAPRYVDLQQFKKWQSSCKLLMAMLGEFAAPWASTLNENSTNQMSNAISMQGSLESLHDAINNNLLVSFEDLVFAEAFSDLMEQANYLFDQNYFLASGVILRAVLEERLSRMCVRNNCFPAKGKPTIADYNSELYRAKIYDKITMKLIESMAAIGNDAAHNKNGLDKSDIERLKHELTAFMQKYSA
jgi:hypothetical protein